MKIKFAKPVIWNGVWTQPQGADGAGGYVVDATDAEIASLNESGSKYEIAVDTPARGKVQVSNTDSARG